MLTLLAYLGCATAATSTVLALLAGLSRAASRTPRGPRLPPLVLHTVAGHPSLVEYDLAEPLSAQADELEAEITAWLRGFIDGEGSIRLVRNARTYAPCIEAAQATYREPLDRLQLTLGGVVTLRNRRTVGGKVVYCWTWKSAGQMRVLLPDLIKYMTVKRDQAEVLLTYVNSMGGRGGDNRFSDEVVAWRNAQALRLIEMKKR